MAKRIEVLFDERFLDKHAGAIISDTAVAIVELVANTWDAFASSVDIVWPDPAANTPFSITDNGKGLTAQMFEQRWRKIDYNRIADEGDEVAPPADLKGMPARKVFGRNGRGRHAAFRFSDPYRVRTWRDGIEVTYEVRRGTTRPFDITQVNRREGVTGHGTEISATKAQAVGIDAEEARQIIGTRFLADPGFQVSLDGTRVSFADVPSIRLKEIKVPVSPYGTVELIILDTLKADRTTQQHGIAWRVKNRLVGTPGWVGFDDERVLDGRRSEAKRFQVIVVADFLGTVVTPDWKGFEPEAEAWQATRAAVHAAIHDYLATFTAARRNEAKETVRDKLHGTVSQLSPAGRDKWNGFVDTVIDTCPTISTDEVQQVAGILANLELSNSKYGLVQRLHGMPPGDLDQLHQILIDWNVRSAKLALDEILSRLKLIEELDRKLRDESADEVRELQPLFDRSLWVFWPGVRIARVYQQPRHDRGHPQAVGHRGKGQPVAAGLRHAARWLGRLLQPRFVRRQSRGKRRGAPRHRRDQAPRHPDWGSTEGPGVEIRQGADWQGPGNECDRRHLLRAGLGAGRAGSHRPHGR